MAFSETIEHIESEIRELTPERGNSGWGRIAAHLLEVQESLCFQPRFQTFSDWIRHASFRAGVHEATLWRYLGAGSFYLAKTKFQIDALRCLSVSSRKLELIQRIEEVSPLEGVALFKRLLSRDADVSQSLLREILARLRGGERIVDRKRELEALAEHLAQSFLGLAVEEQVRMFKCVLRAATEFGHRDILDRAVVLFKTTNRAG